MKKIKFPFGIVILLLISILLGINFRTNNELYASIPLENKIDLLSTSFGFPIEGYNKPSGALNSAGFNQGLSQFNIPPLQEVDSGMGVANPGNLRKGDNATALPSTLLLASTFSKEVALLAGKILGSEAKDKGFNIVLAGGVNLIREPRNGRNFEYASEDPFLSGEITGSFVKGIQSQNVVSTIKHFALNAQENGRVVLNSVINEKDARESDLLAFEIANEIGSPGAVMMAYNKVNGDYASENAFLINHVLKGDWKFKGWVMSDWGGTHSTVKAALAGLDQQSGFQYDDKHYFGSPLLEAVRNGQIPIERIDDMFSRIMTMLKLHNAFSKSKKLSDEDYQQHVQTAKMIAEKGIVLLKNDNILPLKNKTKKIIIIGGYANKGVLSGAGASQVIPVGSFLLRSNQGVQVFHPNSLVEALKRNLPQTDILFYNGEDLNKINKEISNENTIVFVVANQWSKETRDHSSLSLPNNQDQLISSISALNNNVIVILQTGGAVKMPWEASVRGIIEAWYSGIGGGDAIANIILGIVNPAGRLPISFPADENDLPHPILREWSTTTSSPRLPKKGLFDVNYNIEGSDVGYKWFTKNKKSMLYPFGYGLSYTKFGYYDFSVVNTHGKIGTISAKIKNIGPFAGTDTPQIYIYAAAGKMKLVSYSQVYLNPGQEKIVKFTIDPRLISQFNVEKQYWQTLPGVYTLCLSKYAGNCAAKKEVTLEKAVAFKYN